jgi:hypothetical protein
MVRCPKGLISSKGRKLLRSGALAGAGDSDVNELGDGDDRHSGVKDDAKSRIKICSLGGNF